MRTLTAYSSQPVTGATMARTFLTLLALLLAGAAHAQRTPTSEPPHWVKLHERGPMTSRTKDGKELRKDIDGYVTLHEGLNANDGRVLVGAYLYQCIVDGEEKQLFRLVVPTGVAAQAGMRVALVPQDLLDKVLRNEKLDQSDIARVESLTLKLNFVPCAPEGCAAEMEATSNLIAGLKSSAALMVYAISQSGASIALRVPLGGFAETLEGKSFRAWPHARMQLIQELGRCAIGDWPESKRP